MEPTPTHATQWATLFPRAKGIGYRGGLRRSQASAQLGEAQAEAEAVGLRGIGDGHGMPGDWGGRLQRNNVPRAAQPVVTTQR